MRDIDCMSMGDCLGPKQEQLSAMHSYDFQTSSAIKDLVVCNSRVLEPWDLLNGLALGCYQPSPEVLLVS